MTLGARLDLRQSQGLVFTPELQQAIKLLQLSNLELEAFVDAELEQNPLLAREEFETEPAPVDTTVTGGDDVVSALDSPSRAEAALDAPPELLQDGAPGDYATGDAGSATADQDCGGSIDWSKARQGGGLNLDNDALEGALARAPTLREHLTEQLQVLPLSAAEHAVALLLIDAVDEGGYLRLALAETAQRMGCRLALVESVLRRLQGFTPVGVFARDVRECLMLQLADRNRLDPAMQALLDHLDLFARRDLAALRRICGVDDQDLQDMALEIRALSPRPGAAFGATPTHIAVPDVFVRADGYGGWRIELNSDALPRLLVDHRYHARVAAASSSETDKAFLTGCLTTANWLVKSLDQRARTILKVTTEIVRRQDAFLALGVEHLRPLNLRMVADAIGLHESTVSRATANKFIDTPRGVFELKFFFTAAIAATDGAQAHSAASVRHRIKHLIETETRDPRVGREPLSDDRIVELLKASGVEIARRTVTKYRIALRIPSSLERRRLSTAPPA